MSNYEPCPFCGRSPQLISVTNGATDNELRKYFWLECPGCGIKTEKFMTIVQIGSTGIISTKRDGAERVKAFWNTRYIPEPDEDEHPIEGDNSEENLNSLDETIPE